MTAEAGRGLRLEAGPVIPAGELRWDFGPSSGPGGQHANRAHTRAGLTFSVSGSAALTEEQKRRIERRLGGRMRAGSLRITAEDHRSQGRNRRVARERLRALLDEALAPGPPPRRRAARPGPAARRKRLEDKRKRSETKRLRRPPGREPD